KHGGFLLSAWTVAIGGKVSPRSAPMGGPPPGVFLKASWRDVLKPRRVSSCLGLVTPVPAQRDAADRRRSRGRRAAPQAAAVRPSAASGAAGRRRCARRRADGWSRQASLVPERCARPPPRGKAESGRRSIGRVKRDTLRLVFGC